MGQEEKILAKRKKLQPFFLKKFPFEGTEGLPYIRAIGIDHSPKEYFWNNEQREHMVVFQYTLKGKGYLATRHQTYELKEGTFFLAELPNTFTYYRGEEEWSFFYIEFSREYLQWLTQDIQILSVEPTDFRTDLFAKLDVLLTTSEDFFAHSLQSYEVFLKIKKSLSSKKKATVAEEIKDYLETHHQATISLDQLEEIFSLSKYQIIRLFEKEFHQTPMNYLSNYRIVQSLRFLPQREWTIKRIAQTVGFSDVNYFSKVFKKEMGQTPTAYRKKIVPAK
ncbi:AraC family transcriptional regulator [Enterococcus olivae]